MAGLGGLFGGRMGSGLAGAGLGLLAAMALRAIQGREEEAAAAPAATRAQQRADSQARETDAEDAFSREIREATSRVGERQAMTLIRAMIAGANADGTIDAEEQKRVLEKLEQAGASREEREIIARELRTPATLETLVREADTPEMGAQIYAAALLGMRVDSEAERSYLRYLADRLQLPRDAVAEIHEKLGAPEPV
jgi:uncharacterized membrane protein YebE (DUF533 family)